QGSTTAVAENDDGEGLNPRINFTPTESGTYTLRVSAFAPEGRGAYTAGLATLPPLPPAQTPPWRGSGRIEASDPTDTSNSHSHHGEPESESAQPVNYDEHVLRLEGGQR